MHQCQLIFSWRLLPVNPFTYYVSFNFMPTVINSTNTYIYGGAIIPLQCNNHQVDIFPDPQSSLPAYHYFPCLHAQNPHPSWHYLVHKYHNNHVFHSIYILLQLHGEPSMMMESFTILYTMWYEWILQGLGEIRMKRQNNVK